MEGVLHATHWWLWAMPGFCLLPIWAMTLLYFCCYSVYLVFPRQFDSPLSWWEGKYVLSLCEAQSVISSSLLVTLFMPWILFRSILKTFSLEPAGFLFFLWWPSKLTVHPTSWYLVQRNPWVITLFLPFCGSLCSGFTLALMVCEPSGPLSKAWGHRLSWSYLSEGSPPFHIALGITVGLSLWPWKVMGTLEAISSLGTDLCEDLNVMSSSG